MLAFTLVVTSCSKEDNPTTVPAPQTVVDLVVANPQFTLLRAAVVRAGLATTLAGTGPFTVFAPTDAAFQAAGFADVNAINAAPAATLQNVLLYHVITGTAVASSAIQTGQAAQNSSLATNGTLYISKGASGVSVNGARVVQADVQASNGVIHVIDKVLLPPAGNILAVVQADTTLSYLTAAALRGGAAVTGALSSPAIPLTVFAPTNAAFRAAGFPTIAAINAAPVDALTSILTYHVIANARAFSPTLTNGAVLTTFQTGTVTLGVGSSGVTVTGKGNGGTASKVTTADITATNGVIHKIDRVLLP